MTNLSVCRLSMPEQLFCYGTLCFEEVMRRVSGAVPRSAPALLEGYACYALVGLAYPGIVPRQGAQVAGVLYLGLGRAQFAKLDAYEGGEYRRQRVWVNLGPTQRVQVWTYVLQPRYYHRLSDQVWSLAQFAGKQLTQYLHHSHNKLYGLHDRDSNQSA